jgi:hypothetical protein
MSSVRTHALGATPGGMHLNNVTVARGRKSSSGSQWSARRAALYHHICSMLNKNIREPRETGKADNSSNIRQFHKVGYKDAKTWMERRLASIKSSVPNWAATALAGEWQSGLSPDLTNLDKGIAEIKATNLARHYTRRHIPLLGQMEQQRTDSIFRFLGGQLNSASSMEVRRCKVDKLTRLINNWEVQAGGLLEVEVNWGTYPFSTNLALWFREKIPDMGTHTAHNTHEKVAHHQSGGTTTFLCRELVCYIKQRCVDHQGLGRLYSTLFYSDPHHSFRLVSAYSVGCQKTGGDSTIYQQQVCYIQNNGVNLSPSHLFITDFVAQLQVWQQEGDRLLMLMDMNKHVLGGGASEVSTKHGPTRGHPGKLGKLRATRGTELIDGVWFLPELEITLMIQLSFHEGVGDHRTVLVDVNTASAIGKLEFRVVQPHARQLSSTTIQARTKYLSFLERQMQMHQMAKSLNACTE